VDNDMSAPSPFKKDATLSTLCRNMKFADTVAKSVTQCYNAYNSFDYIDV
jgi:hypothetical protein